jgi:SPP1 family predicted phage head-tail adaptor
MAIPAGSLRETVVIEKQTETRNAFGEATSSWSTHATRRAAVESISYSETQRQNRIGGSATFVVRCHYVEGVSGKMRVRWKSRGDRYLYISSVVEIGPRQEHELTCEEKAT